MLTCRGYPSAGGPKHDKHPNSRGNKDAGRNNQQEILSGADVFVSLCAQSLFAPCTLRHHGLLTDVLHTVFQATVITKLSYASPAWWRLTSAGDRDRLEARSSRRSTALGFRPATAPTLGTICSEADDKLFATIVLKPFHLLHHLLPPRRETLYSLRPRVHDFTLLFALFLV